MKRNTMILLGALLVVVAVIALDSLFVVHQTQQAIVMQFGEPKNVITTPGLKLKVPFVQNVVVYDKRVLDLDPPAESVILADQKRIEVDTFTRFYIANPLRFFQAVTTEAQAKSRLGDIVNSSLRRVLGNMTLPAVLSPERDAIMSQIREQVDTEASALGLAVTDVRIRRADLPEETSQAIYARMQSERQREASEARAQGQELAQQIRSRAERERVVIVAEAQRKAQVSRGEGDSDAIRIYAEAFNRDLEFYSFYRSLQAYRHSLRDSDTTFVLSPNSDFFRYFGGRGTAQ